MEYTLDLWECVIDDNGEGIDFISLVDEPAMESNFIALSKHKQNTAKDIIEKGNSITKDDNLLKLFACDKQILTGVVAIPNKKIYRKDPDGYEFCVFFSECTIEKMRDKFMQGNKNASINVHHAYSVSNHFVTEIWIVEDPMCDKALALGLDVPKGTLMASVKVDDNALWQNEIKTGNLRGFSLEGFFTQNLRQSGSQIPQPPQQVIEVQPQPETIIVYPTDSIPSNIGVQLSNNINNSIATKNMSTQNSDEEKKETKMTETVINKVHEFLKSMFEKQASTLVQLSGNKKQANPQHFVSNGQLITIFEDGQIGTVDKSTKLFKLFSDGLYVNPAGEKIMVIGGIAYAEDEVPKPEILMEAGDTTIAELEAKGTPVKEKEEVAMKAKAEIVTPDGLELEVEPNEPEVLKDLKTTKEGFDIYISADGWVTNLKGDAIVDGTYVLSDDSVLEVLNGKLVKETLPKNPKGAVDMAQVEKDKVAMSARIAELEAQLKNLQSTSLTTHQLLDKMSKQMDTVTLAKTPNLQSENAGMTPQLSPEDEMRKGLRQQLQKNSKQKQVTA
jgi:hypothetical protein